MALILKKRYVEAFFKALEPPHLSSAKGAT
jgi:hypothetical protein